MQGRSLARLLAAWALVTLILCGLVHRTFTLDARGAPRAVVASAWKSGALLARAVVARPGEHGPRLDAALASLSPGDPDAALRYESVVAEGPVPAFAEVLLALSLVPGRDGLVATLGDRTEYLTPDDLLAHQAYRAGVRVPGIDLTAGVDAPRALALLAERFSTTAQDLIRRARLRRARFERSTLEPSPGRGLDAGSPTGSDLRDAAVAAGRFLARGVDAEGRFRYLIDGATNQSLPGYDWPRHAGATYFLAQIAALSGEPDLTWAALRAAGQLRERMASCGAHRCIADSSSSELADVGSTALAVLAFVEIARTGLDPAYGLAVPELTAFLRDQQRPDGEFMHRYDRYGSHPVDVQFLYSSGEAAMALSRANSLLHDGRDLEAATRGVAHLVGPAWTFFGSRYYFGEEHWTCLAMADLWDRSPNSRALDFCLGWLGFWGKLQHGPGETPYDADGGYGVGPVQVPPLTPVASRCEAGMATLGVAERASGTAAAGSLVRLSGQMRRSVSLLLRQQFRTGSAARRGLLSSADAVDGAVPATEVDWSLRIDFAQHAGSAMLAAEKAEKAEKAEELEKRSGAASPAGAK